MSAKELKADGWVFVKARGKIVVYGKGDALAFVDGPQQILLDLWWPGLEKDEKED